MSEDFFKGVIVAIVLTALIVLVAIGVLALGKLLFMVSTGVLPH